MELGLDHQAGDELGQAVLEGLAHKARGQEVALDLHVLAQVQAGDRGADAQLGGLHRLVGQIAAQRPLLLDIEARGCIDVRLQAVAQVVEARLEGDLARSKAAGQVRDLVGDEVPLAVVLLGRRLGGRLDHAAVVGGGIEVDHLEVVVQRGQDGLAGDGGREGGDGGEDGARHGEGYIERSLSHDCGCGVGAVPELIWGSLSGSSLLCVRCGGVDVVLVLVM